MRIVIGRLRLRKAIEACGMRRGVAMFTVARVMAFIIAGSRCSVYRLQVMSARAQQAVRQRATQGQHDGQ